MKNFLISVNITIRVPVQANGLYAARAIAEVEARARCPEAGMYTITSSRELVDDGVDGIAQDMAAGLIKSVGQTCMRCGYTAHRNWWGPGWVRCPACLEFAPSAAEQQELEIARAKRDAQFFREILLAGIPPLDPQDVPSTEEI